MIQDLIEKYDDVLLVYPCFPHTNKSKVGHQQIPLPLLKIASLLESYDKSYRLIYHNPSEEWEDNTQYDLIMVTSLFTYWSKYVIEAVDYFRELYPNSYIVGGGIYASLLPQHLKRNSSIDEVITGTDPVLDNTPPNYDLINTEYQILHTTRGCIRKCGFCGTYKVEPQFTYKKTIKNEITKKKLVFYDNNLLANPFIDNILSELILLRQQKKITECQEQSGIDARLLLQKPYLAHRLRKAGFKQIRFAWDGSFKEYPLIQKQINILRKAGYTNRNISVFMIYNYEIPYEEMEKKRIYLYNEGLQVMDCRYHPLTQTEDNYKPRKQQTNKDYYIHPLWTDQQIKTFRKNIRRNNMCLRKNWKYYSKYFEHKKMSLDELKQIQKMEYSHAIEMVDDLFDPTKINYDMM